MKTLVSLLLFISIFGLSPSQSGGKTNDHDIEEFEFCEFLHQALKSTEWDFENIKGDLIKESKYTGKEYESEIQLKDAESASIFEMEEEDESGDTYFTKRLTVTLISDEDAAPIKKLFSNLIESKSECIEGKYTLELEKETEKLKVYVLETDSKFEETKVQVSIIEPLKDKSLYMFGGTPEYSLNLSVRKNLFIN